MGSNGPPVAVLRSGRVDAMRPLVSVLLIGTAAFVLLSRVTTRGGSKREPVQVDKKALRGGRIKFSIGIGLLGVALVLFLMDVREIYITACYILGAGLLAQGYLQEFQARRGRR